MKIPDYQSLIQTMVESGMASPADICGCSESYISQLEEQYKLRLPGSYRLFLSTMGCSSDSVFYSVTFVYPAIEKFRLDAADMLQANGVALQSSAFVFLITDTMFLFFDTKGGDDPPVFRFKEGNEKAEQIYDTFSKWLTDFINSESMLEKQNRLLSREE